MPDFAPEEPPTLSYEQRMLLRKAGITTDYQPPTVDCPHRAGSPDAEAWWRHEWHKEKTWAIVRGEYEAADTDALPAGLPTFPVDVLPDNMRDVVVTVAENKSVPVDLVALLLLSLTAAVAAPRLVIDRRNSWREALNEWTLTLFDSGNRKSPAFEVIQDIITDIEWRFAERHNAAIGDRLAQLEHERGNPPSGASLADHSKAIDAQIKELRENPPPPPRLLVGGSSTAEAIEGAMARNGGHIAIFDDEAGAFGEVSGVYKNNVPTGLDTLLKGYSGSRIPANERIKRAAESIDRAVLTYGITCQPNPLLDSFRIRSLRDRGFHARWCYAIPPWKREEVETPDLNYRAVERFTNTLLAITELPVIDARATRRHQWPALQLSERAWKLHIELQKEFIDRKTPTGDLAHMLDWANKYIGRVLRHAGLLHLAAGCGPDEPVSEDAMRAAIAIGEWSIPHASAVFSRAPKDPRDRGDKDATALKTGRDRIERWIVGSGKTHFTARDVQQKMKRQSWYRNASDVTDVLNQLAADWVVRVVPRTDSAGRQLAGTPWYVPHPDLVFGEEVDAPFAPRMAA